MSLDLEAFWTRRTCGNLVSGQTPVVIDSKMKVEDACDVLSQYGISSAPVYDNEKMQYVGMFDYGDIVAFLLAVMGKEEIPEYETDLREILQKGLRMGPVPVHMIADLSLRNPFVYVLPEAPLLEAVQFFAQGIHRIAVMDSDLSLKGILSQSALITYLVEHLGELEDLALKTLEELQMTRKECVLSVEKSNSVLNGMITMHKNGVASVAIVDRQFKMIGTISLSDIKFIVRRKMFAAFWKSCHEFISYVRCQQALEFHKGFLTCFACSR